jgi:catechol 2,3-dioxygenase-like lactoylglutathione lyase family enzyme
MPTVHGIQTVTVSVSDIGRSLGFYRDLLGFKVLGQARIEPGVTAHFLDIGNQRSLRLLSFDGQAKPGTWIHDDLQTGLRHMAFKVRDVDRTAARLKQAGVHFTLDPLDATGGVRIAFFEDPDGTLCEIVHDELHYHVEGPALGTLPPLKPEGEALIFDHVAVTVSNLDKGLTFFTARLGFPVIGQLLFKDSRGFEITYLKAGSAVLELFSFSEQTLENPTSLDLTVLGFKPVSLSVEDIRRHVENLKAAGIPILRDVTEQQGGAKTALVEAPDRFAVELIEGTPSFQG